MKKLFIVLLLSITLTSCWTISKSSDRVAGEKQEQIMQEVARQVGMPAIVNFQEKKLAKMVFELRDQEKLSTYTYLKNDMSWKLVFLCKSIWYGLPYSIQYTNPMKLVRMRNTSYEQIAIPQADPNGLFMPEGLSSTWVMCINPDTKKPQPVYVESEITVSPFKLWKN